MPGSLPSPDATTFQSIGTIFIKVKYYNGPKAYGHLIMVILPSPSYTHATEDHTQSRNLNDTRIKPYYGVNVIPIKGRPHPPAHPQSNEVFHAAYYGRLNHDVPKLVCDTRWKVTTTAMIIVSKTCRDNKSKNGTVVIDSNELPRITKLYVCFSSSVVLCLVSKNNCLHKHIGEAPSTQTRHCVNSNQITAMHFVYLYNESTGKWDIAHRSLIKHSCFICELPHHWFK